jgi:hypothetical protein
MSVFFSSARLRLMGKAMAAVPREAAARAANQSM